MWFYADATRAQHGPVTSDELAELWRARRIDRHTLVWREGESGWKTLGDFAAELAWQAEPLPPRNSAPPALAAAASNTLPGGVVMPTAVDPGIVRGGFAMRAFALIIDQMIVQMTVGPFIGIAAALLIPAVAGEDARIGAWLAGGAVLLYFALAAAYYALMESSSKQATFGKQALSLKVCDLEGRRLSRGRALLRWFAALLNYLTLYIGWLMIAFGKERRGLHDRLAGTQVVDQYAYTDTPEKQRSPQTGCLDIGLAVGAILFVLFWIGMIAAISIPAYQQYLQRAKLAEAIQSAEPIKQRIVAAIEAEGECPDGMALETADVPAAFSESWIGTFEDGTCGVQLTLADREPLATHKGKKLWLWLDEEQNWLCSSEIENNALPSHCRN